MDRHSQRIDALRTLIVHHWERYHEADAPEIPDADFDALLVELRGLEAERPDLVTADSPSRSARAIRAGLTPKRSDWPRTAVWRMSQ